MSETTPTSRPSSHTFERTKDEQQSHTWSIVKLKNSAPGAPTSIAVQGPVKCIICSGFTEDQLVCEECTESVKLVRAAGNIAILKELIDFASKPGNLAVFQAMADETVGELMLKRIREARDGT